MISYYFEFENDDEVLLPYNYWFFDRIDYTEDVVHPKYEIGSFYKPSTKMD